MLKSRILFMLTGSIAAYKACAVISRLVQDGHTVRAVATPAALKFIGAATLEGLTGSAVLNDLWAEGRAMDHIHLSRWADFGVLCPASANTLNRVAAGLGDDLVGNLLLAWPKGKPLHIFPAMNLEMLRNAITEKSLATLRGQGYLVHKTGLGSLACGEQGSGRLLEPEEILNAITPHARGRILITSGATREPIDGIRFLSNVSTGQTGAALADQFAALGWKVTYVHGPGAVRPWRATQEMPYGSFRELDEVLRKELSSQEYRAVIHAAAVSDYSIAEVNGTQADETAKLSSEQELRLKLKANFKILPRLKEYSRAKDIRVVGFKLTVNEDPLPIARTMLSPLVDAVVANDWSLVRADRNQHPGTLVEKDRERSFVDLVELAQHLNANLGVHHGSHA